MDGELLSALLRDRGATLMQATPATWRVLIDAGWRGSDTFQRAVRRRSRCRPTWRACCSPAAARSGTCTARPRPRSGRPACARAGAPERGISIGTPIANTTVWVLDRAGPAVPAGRARARLCIGGEGVTLGYLGRDDLTADRFIADACSHHAGYRAPARSCIAPATAAAGAPTARSNTSAASISRSRCAAIASSSARSRPRWPRCPACRAGGGAGARGSSRRRAPGRLCRGAAGRGHRRARHCSTA